MFASFFGKKKNNFQILSLYLKLLFRRVGRDNITMVAGHLAYVSLLSIVPLVAIFFALFTAFPVFGELSGDLKHFIFSHFIPTSSELIQENLENFLANSNKMTAVGTCGLIVVALLLIRSIDIALNHIWRSRHKRPIFISFSVYWMILTLGPIFVGASMAVSTYLMSIKWFHMDELNSYITELLRLFPLILSFIGFWVIYTIVPTTKIRVKDAAIGALVASILFELGKKVFSIYVILFPTYQLIYGVLSVIPLLFLWVYLSWCIVLFGAEVTATLSDYRCLKRKVVK